MLVKIEARILIFPGTDFYFPSTSVPPGTFLGSDTVTEIKVEDIQCIPVGITVKIEQKNKATGIRS